MRMTRGGAPRGLYCGMGVCFECLVIVDGVPNTRACMTWVRDGMEIRQMNGLAAARPSERRVLHAQVSSLSEAVGPLVREDLYIDGRWTDGDGAPVASTTPLAATCSPRSRAHRRRRSSWQSRPPNARFTGLVAAAGQRACRDSAALV